MSTPTDAQRSLASRMMHLFTAGHPKHTEAEALRLIVEHDTAKPCPHVVSCKEGTAYCSLAESSVAALRTDRDAILHQRNSAREFVDILRDCIIRTRGDIHSPGMEEIVEAALQQSPERLGGHLVRLRSNLEVATNWLAAHYDAIEPKSAEAEELLTRFRATLATSKGGVS